MRTSPGVTESNAEIARRGYEAVLRGDLEAVAEFLAPDVRWHGGDPNADGACRNRGEALEFMSRAAGRRPLAELVDIIEAGDKVVVILRPRSSGKGRPRLTANVTTF